MTPHNIQAKRHNHVLRNIQTKLTQNTTIITKADKGRTTVIIYITDYGTKVHIFITKNNYNTLPKDPTNKYQQLITTTLNAAPLLTNTRSICHPTPTPTTDTQSTNQTPQTRPTHTTSSEQHRCPSLQTSKTSIQNSKITYISTTNLTRGTPQHWHKK